MANAVLNRQSELILVFEKNGISRQFKNAEFERGALNDLWLIKPKKDKKLKEMKNHSATFPEELVEKILTNFSKENDLIYDPFTGTGTTGVVCKKMKRNFIGSELVSEYADLANKRIEET